jgi:hypothetical protein
VLHGRDGDVVKVAVRLWDGGQRMRAPNGGEGDALVGKDEDIDSEFEEWADFFEAPAALTASSQPTCDLMIFNGLKLTTLCLEKGASGTFC